MSDMSEAVQAAAETLLTAELSGYTVRGAFVADEVDAKQVICFAHDEENENAGPSGGGKLYNLTLETRLYVHRANDQQKAVYTPASDAVRDAVESELTAAKITSELSGMTVHAVLPQATPDLTDDTWYVRAYTQQLKIETD